jgi:hypothetical protein
LSYGWWREYVVWALSVHIEVGVLEDLSRGVGEFQGKAFSNAGAGHQSVANLSHPGQAIMEEAVIVITNGCLSNSIFFLSQRRRPESRRWLGVYCLYGTHFPPKMCLQVTDATFS